jgi:hypothetical protein
MGVNRITMEEWQRLAGGGRKGPPKAAPKKPGLTKAPTPVRFTLAKVRGRVDVTIDGLRLIAELNRREHHMATHRRSRSQKSIVRAALGGVRLREWVTPPLVVTMVRTGPKKMDKGDNLQSSCKWVRDQIAEELGVNDGSDEVAWLVEGKVGGVGVYAVGIRIEEAS